MYTYEAFVVQLGERPWNAYVRHPEFSSLYLRRGPVYVNGEIRKDTITIANLEAMRKGQGAFTRLFEDIKSKGFGTFVECVQNERFCKKLEALGFERVNEHSFPPSYFFKPT